MTGNRTIAIFLILAGLVVSATLYLINNTGTGGFRKPDRLGEVSLGGIDSPDQLVWVPEQKRVFVTDTAAAHIYAFSLEGEAELTIGPRGYMQQGFISPDSISAYEGGILVADRTQRTVFYYNRSGRCIGEAITEKLPIDFVPGRVYGLKNGKFVVADYSGKVLYVFAPDGKVINRISDSEKNLFAGLSGLHSRGETIYAFDYVYDELISIDINKGKIERKKLKCEQTSQLLPQGIIYSKGLFYTAEPLFSRVYAFDNNGSMVGEFGDTLNENTAVKMPVDIACAGRYILVLEKEGKKVSLWSRR